MEMTAQASVVIVNYNAGQCLADCVQSIMTQALEIIVVDNASSDNSLSLLESQCLDHKKLTVLRNKYNQGFAKACNLGASHATGDYLLFLNPDCFVEKQALDQLIQVCESDPKIGMAGGLLLNPDGSEQPGGRRMIPTPWRSFVRAFRLSRLANRWPQLFQDFRLDKKPLPTHPIQVDAISGACMMVKREAIDDVGLFDDSYFMHCEDLDWCHRFQIKQWTIMFVPQARITHFKGTCSKKTRLFVEWHKHQGMIKYYKKFFKHQYPGILMWLVTLGVYCRFSLVMVYCFFVGLINSSLGRREMNNG